MAVLFWDASGLAKRYFGEIGSATVNAVFANATGHEMATTAWGYAETHSLLVRRLNSGAIDLPTFTAATTALQTEVVDDTDFGLLPISKATIFASLLTVRQHNLNATDAANLTMLLDQVPPSTPDSPICVMIAADRRLLRAAEAEGFRTLNPELLAAADVPGFLGAL
jgi:hypothetical protein